MDLDGIGRAAEVVHAAVRLAAVWEQDGNAAAGAVGGFKVLIAQPQVLIIVLGERGRHAALLGRDGERALAVGQGQGLIRCAVLFVDASGQFGHKYILLIKCL